MSIVTSSPLSALFVALLASLALGGCAISLDLEDEGRRRVVTDSVPVDGLAGIAVTTENGAIDVSIGSEPDIEIRTTLREARDGDASYSIDIDGDRLVLDGSCDSRWWQQCAVGFEVTVPAEFDVALASDSGQVTVDGIAGEVELETTNGAIDAERLDTTTVRARSGNGRVRIELDTEPEIVDARTGNGAIEVLVPQGDTAYAVDATSDNGGIDVDVSTDPAAELRIVVRSGNGSIDVGQRTPSG